MKRSALIKHLQKNGCQLLREGTNHAIYHQELDNQLCKKICKQLEIPVIS